MCLIFLAYRSWPGYQLVVAANRDEFHDRPTRAMHVWEDADKVVGGRDLLAGGSWMATTLDRRFAALTNFRTGRPAPRNPRSRGAIVANFVTRKSSIEAYRRELADDMDAYVGFSALFFQDGKLGFFSNCSRQVDDRAELAPGVYGLSNALLDTPWPKVESGKKRMSELLDAGPPVVEELIDMLADRDVPSDRALPDTGVGIERERTLAPRFIYGEQYGTRTSSVLLLADDGGMQVVEQSYSATADALGRVEFEARENTLGEGHWHQY